MNPKLQNNLSQIKKLMLQNGVQKAYAFGSAVKDTMHAGSDFDFIIRFPSNLDYETYGNNYFNLLHALQELLKTDVDLVAEETLSNPYLLESINQNKMALL